ncbi:MAG: hypothetical protein FWC40_03410 [Proteobacteria bacterium]|nr:hypothetical protein [Pseudomonadota bacterium]
MKKTVLILAASSLFFAFGCDKKTEKTPDGAAQQQAADGAAQQQAAVSIDLANWNKADVNALLKFIPSDTVMAFVSTREYDMEDPVMKSLFARSKEMMDKTNALVKKIDDDEMTAFYSLWMKEFKPLLDDYKNVAPSWGMDPLGRSDSAIYLTDEYLVAKGTAIDATVLREKLEGTVKSAIKAMGSEEDIKEVVRIKTLDIKGEQWIRYDLGDEGDDDGFSVFVHYSKNIVTLAIPLSSKVDQDSVNATLSAAAKPLDKSALGSLDNRPIGLGFIDNKGITDKVLKSQGLLGKAMSELLLDGEALSEVCASEISGLAGIFPRTVVRMTMDGKSISYDFTTTLASAETLSAIQGLKSTVLDFSNDKTLAGLSFSLNIGKTVDFLAGISSKISKSPYKCDSLSFLNDMAEGAAALPELLSMAPQFSAIKTLNGFSAYLQGLELDENNDIKQIDIAASVLGKDLGAILKMGTQALGVKELSKLKFAKGKAEKVDLSKLAGIPLNVSTLLTDNGLLLAAGQEIDIQVLGKTEPKQSDSFISFIFDYKTLASIMPDMDLGVKYSMSFGVNSEGLSVKVVTEF